MNAPYLSYTFSVGRNSQFYDLTQEQRDELGGIEYRSLKTLAWILVGKTVSYTEIRTITPNYLLLITNYIFCKVTM